MNAPMLIDYYFWLSSDWSLLGHRRFLSLARRFGAKVCFHPMRMKELLDLTGGVVLNELSRQRRDYRMVELQRWRDRLGFPITLNPKHFPVDNERALRVVAGAVSSDCDVGDLVEGYMRAVWIEDRDISDQSTVIDIAVRHGLDAARAEYWIAAADSSQALSVHTRAAAAAGVFGAPSYVVAGEVFWGQDRLDFLAERLQAVALAAACKT